MIKNWTKFNEELDKKTYINAADKLEDKHPDRAKKLRDYANKDLIPYEGLTWDFIVAGEYNGDEVRGSVKNCKIEFYKNRIPKIIFNNDDLFIYYKETGDQITNDINCINIDDSPVEGAPVSLKMFRYLNRGHLELDCYLESRQEAIELSKILKSLGSTIQVNNLFTSNKEYIESGKKTLILPDEPKKKKRWFR